MDVIQQAIDRAAGVKIVILDACRNNPLENQFGTRAVHGGGISRGLARIDRTEGQITLYATAPGHVAQDGVGRNSPFTEALVRHIKEPSLEIYQMFRRVTNDVYERTNHSQRPFIDASLLDDYYLNRGVTDSIEWSRILDSVDETDFREFIRKFPTSPFTREAQYRINLFEHIRAANEEDTRVRHACDVDRKTLAAVKDNDIGALKSALDQMTCQPVSAEAQQRVAKLEDEIRHNESVCADERKKLDAIDANAVGARQQYIELQAQAVCTSLRADISGIIKKIDLRVKEAQTELARLGCYNAPINGRFDEVTKKSLARYISKKGPSADDDYLTDDLVSELKQQHLGLCPSESPSAPVVATPSNGTLPSKRVAPKQIEHATRKEIPPRHHNRQDLGSGGREEVPVARPSRGHKVQSAAREEVPVSKPSRHGAREEEPARRIRQRPHPPKSVVVERPAPRSYSLYDAAACSEQADVMGLHGKARWEFREQCMYGPR